jgi:hypothetical protein
MTRALILRGPFNPTLLFRVWHRCLSGSRPMVSSIQPKPDLSKKILQAL